MLIKLAIRNLGLVVAGILIFGNAVAESDSIKAKTLRIIVPLPAGSAPDVIARKISENLGKSLQIPVIVENKPGFSGFVGGQDMLRYPADGSALYMSISSFIVIAPQIYSKIPYNPVKDFRPLVQIGRTPIALAVSAVGKFNNLNDYVEEAKKNPEGISFASFGNGTSAHLLGEGLMQSAHIKLRHVPYKQSASTDVIGGHIDATIADIGSLTPYLGDKPRMKILAITGEKRDPNLPDVPTFRELGYSNLESMVGWYGVFGPKSMPTKVADHLSQSILEATSAPQFKSSMAMLGYQYTGITGDQFTDIVNADYKRWGDVIRSIGGIRLD
ncbi:MAG: tripartite tricarboxylate transporter substrate binding protein [Proteobacteria bacterium]|nr:tripartite tricarboxylate transporter substrate binding protein [Pseudomonadota bacterium]MBS0493886.1 tripartite tricarboxylate transporter substrate binding protein [Pseudomonadota bacterium]